MMENDMFKKLLLKKWKEQGEKPADGEMIKAKGEMADKLSKLLQSDIAGDIKSGMQKVTVASNSKKGLEEGLDMAKDKLSFLPEQKSNDQEEQEEEEGDDNKLEEDGDNEHGEGYDADEEISCLEKKLNELKMKKRFK